MSRSRILSIIIVLLLANFLVFSNLGILLWNGVGEATTRLSATRQPRTTDVPEETAVPVASDTPAPPTAVPAPTSPPPTAAPAVSPTPAASPTPVRAAIPFYTPGAPLKYPFRYVVKQGDYLSVLANTFKVPMAKILAANNLTNPDHIRIGQELIIPDPAQ